MRWQTAKILIVLLGIGVRWEKRLLVLRVSTSPQQGIMIRVSAKIALLVSIRLQLGALLLAIALIVLLGIGAGREAAGRCTTRSRSTRMRTGRGRRRCGTQLCKKFQAALLRIVLLGIFVMGMEH